MEGLAPSMSTTPGFQRSRLLLVLLAMLAAVSLCGCVAPNPARDFGRMLREHPDEGALIEGVPLPPPDPANSGMAVLSSVLDYWNQPASPAAIQRWMESDGLKYSPEERLSRFAWSEGLWTHVQAGSLAAIRQRIRNGVPPVVVLQDRALDPYSARRAIVVGFDDRKDLVLCLEPPRRATAYAYSEFMTRWRAGREWMITFAEPEPARWTLDGQEHLSRARFYEYRGDPTNAFADYSAALDAGLENSSLQVRIGNLHRTLGRSAQAEQAYRRALELDDHNGRAYNNLAYLLAEEDRSLDEAVALARQAMILEPTNPMAMDTLGVALYRKGSFREASDVLERAQARARWLPDSTRAEIGIHLALAHAENQQPHLAREVLAHVLELDPHAVVPDTLKPLLDSSASR